MGEICIHAHCGHCRMDKWGARLARGRGCGRYDYYNEKKCGAFLHNAKCKFCSGKGKMSVQSACNACNGTGEYKGERRAQAGERIQVPEVRKQVQVRSQVQAHLGRSFKLTW